MSLLKAYNLLNQIKQVSHSDNATIERFNNNVKEWKAVSVGKKGIEIRRNK